MGKKTASIIGIVLGIAIIIIGISVMNPETILLGKRDSLGSLLGQYGADFYTDIYHMTYEVGFEVQKAYVNICNAIGWLIVAVGLVDIAYFVYKMASCEDDGARVGHNKVTPTTLPPQKDIFASVRVNTSTSTVKRCPDCGDIVKSDRCEMCGKEVK